MTIGLLILDNMIEASVFFSLNAAQYLNAIDPKQNIRVVTIGTKPLVKLSNGYSIKPNERLDTTERLDVLIVPGLFYYSEKEIVSFLDSDVVRKVNPFLVAQFKVGVVLAASCVGTFLLAEAGLLKKKKATTIWWQLKLFQSRYSETNLLSDKLVVHDGSILTAGSAFAHVDLISALVDKLFSKKIANLFHGYTLSPSRIDQSSHFDFEMMAMQDSKMAELVRFIGRQLNDSISIKTLADRIGLSMRTLNRRTQLTFNCAPKKLIAQMRCKKACDYLKKRDLSIERISEAVGYSDARLFRRAFHMQFKVSPLEYRKQFLK